MRSFVPAVAMVAAALLASSIGCSSSDRDQDTGATCPSTSTLTYGTFGKAFMDKYCVSCHGGSQSPRLGTLPDVQGARSQIMAVAGGGPNAVNTYMPSGSPTPTEAERKQLGEWLACGAK
jgi:mono/diheme cytochrome c family protein